MNCVTGAIGRRRAAAGVVLLTSLAALLAAPTTGMAQERAAFIAVSAVTTPPIGWAEFCIEYAPECDTRASLPRDVALSARAWAELKPTNVSVNASVKPMTHMHPCSLLPPSHSPDSPYLHST